MSLSLLVIAASLLALRVEQACCERKLLSNHAELGDSEEIAYDHAQIASAQVVNKCSSLKSLGERLVVVARHKEDISWLVEHVDTPFFAYQTENSSGPDPLVRRNRNGAMEASAYLQYIAEFYDCLPDRTAFMHAHRSSWHSDDMVEVLNRLKWNSISGFMPLHSKYFQPYGLYVRLDITDLSKNLKTVLATGAAAQNGSFSSGQIVNGTAYVDQQAYHYRQAGDVLFAWLSVYGPAGLGPVPEAIRYYCCAQFVVTKARIQRFPRQFYLQAMQHATDGRTTDYFRPSYARAILIEALWHIMFGEPAILPKAPEEELCEHFTCDGQSW